MGIKSVSNTGPLLHMNRLNLVELLKIFSPIITGFEVKKELSKYGVTVPGFVKIIGLSEKSKDFVQLLTLQYELDFGEAEAITLVRQENAKLFFTDDLDARETAKSLGIEVHGTIGILLRSFRNGKITKKEVIDKLRNLKSIEFFVTTELIENAINEINNYRK